jgi:hypothetical protein
MAKRIQETRRIPAGGFHTDTRESRVIEIADDAPVPAGAVEVPADTPLSDWTQEN